nr:hypothetical protein [Campylobacter sp.]
MSNKIFLLAFIGMSIFLGLNLNKINSDIYELTSLKFEQKQKQSLDEFNKILSFEVLAASSNLAKFDEFIQKAENFGIFESIRYKIDDISNYQRELEKFKIALLDDESVELLENDGDEFAKRSAKEIFSKFKPLPLSQDFFSFSAHFRLNQENNIKFDPSKNRFISELDGVNYYFAKLRLQPKFNENLLLELSEFAKNNEILISGNAIYGALGKKLGNTETTYIGGASLVLCLILLLLAFKNIKILYLLLVIIFGECCGLFFTFLFFDSVHILSIVVSISLIGLMLDFSVHWLGANSTKRLRKFSIYRLKGIFLLGFLITAGGYSVFLLSPFFLLKQIAIFAIFALLGAFLFSYFCLPNLLNLTKFNSSKILNYFLDKSSNLIKFIPLNSAILAVLSIILAVFLGFFMKFEDNISQYWSMDENLTKMTQKLSTLSPNSFDLVIIEDEYKLVKTLLDKDLIESYNGVSKFLLNPKSQDFVTLRFEFLNISEFVKLGFSEYFIRQEIKKIQNHPTLTYEDAKNSELFSGLWSFANLGQNIIFLNGIKDLDEVERVVGEFGGLFVNLKNAINEAFWQIKINAIILKIVAYALAFLLLAIFFNTQRAFFMILAVFCANLITLFVLTLCGFSINIFAIFGLILGGAVGIDYMIFALNHKMNIKEKIFGINLAALTSMISFFALSFSQFNAIKIFGLAVGINILLCCLFAQIYAHKQSKFDKIPVKNVKFLKKRRSFEQKT